MDDQDWLDQRLAVDAYIPDDGFTARVVSRLPTRLPRAVEIRRRILALTAFLAVCLAAVQVVPLYHAVQQFSLHHSPLDFLVRMLDFLLQPTVLIGAAAVITLLAVASIPFLRRWA